MYCVFNSSTSAWSNQCLYPLKFLSQDAHNHRQFYCLSCWAKSEEVLNEWIQEVLKDVEALICFLLGRTFSPPHLAELDRQVCTKCCMCSCQPYMEFFQRLWGHILPIVTIFLLHTWGHTCSLLACLDLTDKWERSTTLLYQTAKVVLISNGDGIVLIWLRVDLRVTSNMAIADSNWFCLTLDCPVRTCLTQNDLDLCFGLHHVSCMYVTSVFAFYPFSALSLSPVWVINILLHLHPTLRV